MCVSNIRTLSESLTHSNVSSKMNALVQEKKAGYVRIELGVQEGTRQIVASVSHINAYYYWKIGENPGQFATDKMSPSSLSQYITYLRPV